MPSFPLTPEEREKTYLKWREIQRNQLGVSSNVFLTITGAMIALQLNLLIKEPPIFFCCIKSLFELSIILYIISGFFFIWFTYNRLIDFRETAGHYDNYEKKYERDTIEDMTRDRGKRTWFLFNAQIAFFILGFFLSIIGFSFII